MLSQDELAMLKNIAVNPLNDTMRLIYADFLCDRADEQKLGDMVRAQVEHKTMHKLVDLYIPCPDCRGRQLEVPCPVCRGTKALIACKGVWFNGRLKVRCSARHLFKSDRNRSKFRPSLWLDRIVHHTRVTMFELGDCTPISFDTGTFGYASYGTGPLLFKAMPGKRVGDRIAYETLDMAVEALALAAGRLARSYT